MTTAYPSIAFLPAKHTDATAKLLEVQKANPVQRTAAKLVVRSAVSAVSVDDTAAEVRPKPTVWYEYGYA